MASDRIAAAQRGVSLGEAVRMAAPSAKGTSRRGRGTRRQVKAARVLSGPFIAQESLTRAERERLIDGIEAVISGLYTHLPLKRARYGTDPVQRLRILRSQIDE